MIQVYVSKLHLNAILPRTYTITPALGGVHKANNLKWLYDPGVVKCFIALE